MLKCVILVAVVTFLHKNHEVDGKYTSMGMGMGGGGMGMGGGGMGIGGGGMGMGGGGMGMGGGGMGMGGGGMGMGMGMMGMGGGGMGMGGFGGSVIDQSNFNEGKKNLNDLFFKKAQGNQGGQFGQGQSGFQKGEGMKKMLKGEQGSFNGFNGGKKMFENGYGFQGGEHFNKNAKKGDEQKEKKGHKKGHTVKGFKTSHQKDENSATEEFYDEEHDEAGKQAFSGQQGQFGEKKDSAFKGEKADKEFKGGEQKKTGKYDQNYMQGKENEQQGQYGNKKFAGDQSGYALNKEGDAKKAGGHHESSGLYKHYPIHY